MSKRALGRVADGRALLVIITATGILTSVFARASVDDRGWLGIYSDPVAELPAIEESAGGSDALEGAISGLLVTVVFPDSPAEKGGLLEGDIIVATRGEPFFCPADSVRAVFSSRLEGKTAGTPFPLRVIRDVVSRSFDHRTVRWFDADETQAGGPGSSCAPDPEEMFWQNPQMAIDEISSGDSLSVSVSKRQAVKELPVILGLRPEARWPSPRSNADILRGQHYSSSEFTPIVWSLADEFGVRAETEDLLHRLNRCHAGSDPFRLETMMLVHRDPFLLEGVTRRIIDGYAGISDGREGVVTSIPLLVPLFEPAGVKPFAWDGGAPGIAETAAAGAPPRLLMDEAKDPAAALLDDVERVLSRAREYHSMAFAALTGEEKAFLDEERWNLSDAFAGEVYIHFDEDRGRFAKNKRILDLARKVDYGTLLECAETVGLLTDPEWARAAGELLRHALTDSLAKGVVLERDTPFGRLVIGGTGNHWHRGNDTAFLIDLGGDDFYTGNCGGSAGWGVPISVCIDISGDDAYEATTKSCQGTGCLGVGALLDLEGNDEYIGQEWAQGTGYFGVGWLHDASGDDVYRGRTFCQGVGLFGVGLLIDDAGDDRYEGDCHVQGVGLARGIGATIEHGGNDEYYAKGLYPTGYGDAGIFDAWSQGCGMGFRTLASGGLGLLLDEAGVDRMEAGNFSQGGGYYYGYGIVSAGGYDGDTYIGSRYNQGFCAHQAVGVFLESGGDDRYTTRQGVAQGLAWDECVTLFMDEGGDDIYEGGSFFSQGASAHNSFCFFLDRGGDDVYDYVPGPARAGGNNYHGGTSFSLFIDEHGRQNSFLSPEPVTEVYSHHPEHGFVLDLDGSVQSFMSKRDW
jgi:hypothetical protein